MGHKVGALATATVRHSFPWLLLLPADPTVPATVIEPDEDWRLARREIAADVQTVVWGRAPKFTVHPSKAGAAYAIRREAALMRLRARPPKGFRVTGIRRLAPSELDPRSVRARVRTAVLSGAVVEMWRIPPAFRVVDAIAESAGAVPPVRYFRRTSGDGMLARLRGADGSPLWLRASQAGFLGDPARGGEALERLGGSPDLPAPRLVASGATNGASWTVETGLPGRRPRSLRPAMTRHLASICARFPLAEEPASAFVADVELIAEHFPIWAHDVARATAASRSRLSVLPSILCHGDLWAGNLLARGDTVSGIVDWDSWAPAGVPGTDLINALATQLRVRRRSTLGRVWLDAPWRSDDFSSWIAPYWRGLGVEPTPELLDDVALAWWAQQIAAHIRRAPSHAEWREWVEDNVASVVRGFAEREAKRPR